MDQEKHIFDKKRQKYRIRQSFRQFDARDIKRADYRSWLTHYFLTFTLLTIHLWVTVNLHKLCG